ncbi:hypothetical protein NUACC21_62290 [Scytonema sp. NUACC21]
MCDFKELIKVNQQLTLALEAGNMGIWDWDLLSDRVVWSTGHERLFGLSPGTFPGTYEAVIDCIHPDDRETVILALKYACTQGHDFHEEFRVVWSDSSIHWIESKGKCVYNNENQAVRMLGTVVEISPRIAKEEQLHLLESVVVHTNNAVLLVKPKSIAPLETQIVYTNPAFSQMTGYTQQEVFGKALCILIGEDQLTKDKLRTAMQTRQSLRVDLIIYTKENREIWVEVSIFPVADKTGSFSHWVVMLRDITERKQAEASLQQLNQELENRVQQRTMELERSQATLQQQLKRQELMMRLVEQIRQSLDLKAILNIAIAEVQKLLTTDRVFIYQVHHNNTGTVVAEVVKCGCTQILDKTISLEAFPKKAQEDFLKGQIYTLTDCDKEEMLSCEADFLAEIQVRAMMGIPIIQQDTLWGLLIVHQCSQPREWQTWEINLLKQLTNQMAMVIKQLELYQQLQEELRDRQQAEVALRQSEALFRSVCQSLPVGIFRTDAWGKNIYTNPCYQAIGGFTFEEALGDGWMQFIHPEDLQAILPELTASVAAKREYCGKGRSVRRDGTVRYCKFRAVPIFSESGGLVGYVGIVEDITESRAIEKIKNEFISVVSHELRTPLASIRGSLGLLASGILKDEPETAQQMLQIAANDTERLVRLVNEILDLERLAANKVALRKQWCDVSTLMQQSVETLQPLAAESNINLSIFPISVQVWADADRIIQTLVNLVGNAIKFSPPETTVTLSAETLSDRVLFKVQDQGRGIPKDKLEIIFGRFQQVDASDSRQKGGTGLGLAICRSIVEQHGGRIWAESVLGKGSIFYFTLPKASTN